MARMLKPELDVAKTVEKICGHIDDDIARRTKVILAGDMSEAEYKDACGYMRAVDAIREMILDAFTYDPADKGKDSQ